MPVVFVICTPAETVNLRTPLSGCQGSRSSFCHGLPRVVNGPGARGAISLGRVRFFSAHSVTPGARVNRK